MEIDPSIVAAIYRNTFRITVITESPAKERKAWSGTAFCIGHWRNSRRMLLATARHVLTFESDDAIQMILERFDEEDGLTNTVTVRCTATQPDRPFGFYKLSDVAFLTLPESDDTGATLIDVNESPLRVLEHTQRLTAGSWVAWSGFPGQVEQLLGHPQLCFFQGTVSAFGRRSDQAGHAYYIVDGHVAQGVSGGPVFEILASNQIQVCGIVSSYCGADRIPGFCCFEPINPILAYAAKHWQNDSLAGRSR